MNGRFDFGFLKLTHNIFVQNETVTLQKGGFNDLGFYGPPTPADRGPYGFDNGRSLVAE